MVCFLVDGIVGFWGNNEEGGEEEQEGDATDHEDRSASAGGNQFLLCLFEFGDLQGPLRAEPVFPVHADGRLRRHGGAADAPWVPGGGCGESLSPKNS